MPKLQAEIDLNDEEESALDAVWAGLLVRGLPKSGSDVELSIDAKDGWVDVPDSFLAPTALGASGDAGLDDVYNEAKTLARKWIDADR